MGNVLTTDLLTKKYKKHFAVNGVSMNIDQGDIYGFVGENGSGKTTVIRLITGLIYPYSGSFKLFGVDNRSKNIGKARSRVGAIVESPSIYMNMSAYDNLKMQCALLGVKDQNKIIEVLNDVGLGDLYNVKKHASDFSLGMLQRLGIAMALLGEPELLILDEPMNGLDPAGIVEI
ncbi:MAG: ATP-binding cassette domain-containing protein, partial [Clostridia bacterium]|nr:ATP-binding cassette domain-containing protein [Clostridia bacterium]